MCVFSALRLGSLVRGFELIRFGSSVLPRGFVGLVTLLSVFSSSRYESPRRCLDSSACVHQRRCVLFFRYWVLYWPYLALSALGRQDRFLTSRARDHPFRCENLGGSIHYLQSFNKPSLLVLIRQRQILT